MQESRVCHTTGARPAWRSWLEPGVDKATGFLNIEMQMVKAVSVACVPLPASFPDERAVLVAATDAILLCRQAGFEETPLRNAVALIDRIGRGQMAELRHFVSRCRLSPIDLRDVDDPGLLGLLRTSLRWGSVAVVRERGRGAGDQKDPDVERWRLVRDIETKSRHRLNQGGRQYKLVVGSQLDQTSNRDSFEVVSRRVAVEVLHAIASTSDPGKGGLAELLNRAADWLTDDWRPPQSPDGLVLLRKIVQPTGSTPDLGPALTPSQLKKLGQTHWIEIELVNLDGEPCSLPYRLELPGQSDSEGKFDDDGFVGVYAIDAGTAKLFIDGPSDATQEITYFDLWVRLHVDPRNASSIADVFRLTSSDGEVSMQRTVADDLVANDDCVDLLFAHLDVSKSYSLEVIEGDDSSFLFENVLGSRLQGGEGSGVLGRGDDGGEEVADSAPDELEDAEIV